MNQDGSNDTLVDIGHGVRISVRKLCDTDDSAGIYYEHQRPDGSGTCHGWVPFKPHHNSGWDVASLDPLTISPSMLCRACGHHGFIRDGKWVPA